MTKENVPQESYDEFLYAVQNLVSSKYLMIDRRISELLKAIANNDTIYNLIAECMVNFDFIEEWKNSVKTGRLTLPDDPAKKISFVFCMLNNIDDKNLDLTKVLEHYFSYSNASPYELFCNAIVLEFRNQVMTKLGFNVRSNVDASETSVPEEETIDATDVFDRLLQNLSNIKQYVSMVKKPKLLSMPKQDLLDVITTFEFAVKKQDVEYFYALTLTIKDATLKLRDLKNVVVDTLRAVNSLIEGN